MGTIVQQQEDRGFISYEKRGNKTYAYRRVNQRDATIGQSRCVKKEYLGVYNPETGEITPKRSRTQTSAKAEATPIGAKCYGGSYLVNQIIEKLGLSPLLCNLFGESASEKLLELVKFKCISADSLYLFENWKEDNLIKLTKGQEESSSLSRSCDISLLISQIGSASGSIEGFFDAWSKKLSAASGLFFDLTSISTHRTNNELGERGYNKDNDRISQVNLGVVYSQTSELPLAYRSYPGSIRDVSTIKNMLELFSALNLAPEYLVLDKGFYSVENLAKINESKVDFIISMPTSRKLAKKLILDTSNTITEPRNNFIYNKESLYCEVITGQHLADNGDAYNAYLYCDEKKQAREKSDFMLSLDYCETKLRSSQFTNIEQANSYMKAHFTSVLAGCFQVRHATDGTIAIDRNYQAIENAIAFKGKFLLLTNASNLSPAYVLELYRKKDQIEKVFDDLKNEINEKKFRTKTDATFRGKLFLNFLCLIVIAYMRRVMRNKNLYRDFSIASLFQTLQKLKVFELTNGSLLLAEITSKQKDIFKAFEFPLPSIPH